MSQQKVPWKDSEGPLQVLRGFSRGNTLERPLRVFPRFFTCYIIDGPKCKFVVSLKFLKKNLGLNKFCYNLCISSDAGSDEIQRILEN